MRLFRLKQDLGFRIKTWNLTLSGLTFISEDNADLEICLGSLEFSSKLRGFSLGLHTYIRILAQQGCPGHVLNSTTYCKVGRERAWVLGSQDRMELLWEFIHMCTVCIELPWFLKTSYQTKLYCTNHFALVTLFLRNIMVHTKNTPRGTVRNWPILCNSIADPDLVGSVSCFRLNKYLNLGSRDPNSDYCFVNLVLSNKKSVFCSFRKCLPHIVK